jgi:outer membrane protein assembly factor BamA
MATCLILAGCAASIPKDAYGVASVDIHDADHFDDDAIKACLATFPRERFGFVLGGGKSPECGTPPFDETRVPVHFWAWPWTDWPIYNDTAFERDLDRVERWYKARGYYDARVTSAKAHKFDDDRQIELEITVHEGQPVLVVRVTIAGIEPLDDGLEQDVKKAVELELGEPFDEALYERSKRRVLETLQEASYAKAEVSGQAMVDPEKKLARVELTVNPGPPCVFGDVRVEGEHGLNPAPVLAAASLDSGQPFSLSALRDARFGVYALGPFASVEIDDRPRDESPIVDVTIRVAPARAFRFGLGAGMMAGGVYAQDFAQDAVGDSFAQWDVHLLGRIEHRNFLGGMRRLRIEERPRLIFSNPFPSPNPADVGNLLTVELRQPAFLEPRTTLVAMARWDLGPDPYGGNFMRNDIVLGVGPERYFFEGKLLVAVSVNAELFLPNQVNKPYPRTELTYFNEVARVDLRDDPRNTHRGSYFAFGVQHAGYFVPSDWNYVRLTQDSRGYVPLPGGMVLAARARLGWMAVTSSRITLRSADPEQVPFLEDLINYGPLRHRLRGGGHNSVRGYAPNELGDIEMIDNRLLSGGLRQWEASIELRIPISESFGTVLFTDAGDVSRLHHASDNSSAGCTAETCSAEYRFYAPQLTFGVGLRYRTLVGPLRLDVGIAPKGLQDFGKPRSRTDYDTGGQVPQNTPFGIEYGEVSFTIGEAF